MSKPVEGFRGVPRVLAYGAGTVAAAGALTVAGFTGAAHADTPPADVPPPPSPASQEVDSFRAQDPVDQAISAQLEGRQVALRVDASGQLSVASSESGMAPRSDGHLGGDYSAPIDWTTGATVSPDQGVIPDAAELPLAIGGGALGVPLLAGAVLLISDRRKYGLPAQDLSRFERPLPKEARGIAASASSTQPLDVEGLTRQLLETAGQALKGERIYEEPVIQAARITHSAVTEKTSERAQKVEAREAAKAEQNWFQNHLVPSGETRRLGKVIEGVDESLVGLRGLNATACLVLALDDDLSGNYQQYALTSRHAQAGVTAAANGPSHDQWTQALSRLAKDQQTLEATTVKVTGVADSIAEAVVDFKTVHTSVFNRQGWADAAFGGKSVTGDLFRRGVARLNEADGVVDQFEALSTQGRDALDEGINQLLKHEDEDYRLARIDYDHLEPMHASLGPAVAACRVVPPCVRELEWAQIDLIAKQATLAATPMHSGTDAKGNPQYNPAYGAAQSAVSMAQSRLFSAQDALANAIHTADSALHDLYDALPPAGSLENYSGVRRDVEDLRTLFASSGTVGESGNAAKAARFWESTLEPMRHHVDAAFSPLSERIWGQIRSREEELLQLPG